MASASASKRNGGELRPHQPARRTRQTIAEEALDEFVALERPLRVGDRLKMLGKLALIQLAVLDRDQTMSSSRERVRRRDERLAPRRAAPLRRRRRSGPRSAGRARAGFRDRSASDFASITRSHSVSVPIERLLRLAEPTRRDSIIDDHDLGVHHGVRDALAGSYLGTHQAHTLTHARLPEARAGTECGRCAWCDTRTSSPACAARPAGPADPAFARMRWASALAIGGAGQKLVLDVDLAFGRRDHVREERLDLSHLLLSVAGRQRSGDRDLDIAKVGSDIRPRRHRPPVSAECARRWRAANARGQARPARAPHRRRRPSARRETEGMACRTDRTDADRRGGARTCPSAGPRDRARPRTRERRRPR